jgi:hypothetical protein
MMAHPDTSSPPLESVQTGLSSGVVRRAIVETVCEVVISSLEESRPGHCLRVGALAESAMRELCAELNTRCIDADIVLLLGPRQQSCNAWEVSATRLIELRNAARRPLLVCVPPGLRTPAEDSFDVSTFRELPLADIPRQLRKRLRAELAEDTQRLTDLALGYLHEGERIAGDDAVVSYYLTLLQNLSHTSDPVGVAGGAIYQLGMIPDFELFRAPDRIKGRLSRSADALHILIGGTSPLLGRIHQLKLAENTVQADLYRFLRGQPVDKVSIWGAAIATDAALRHLAFDQWRFKGEERRPDH